MAPLRGWGAKGKRLRHGHWRTLTFLGALRHDRLTAPCVFDGPINGQCFRAYVAQVLVPILQSGDIVVMDNLGSHKSAEIRWMIRAAGVRLWYLPPYSPDFNPCMDGPCGSRMADRFWVDWSAAAMYTASDVQRDPCAP